MMTQSATTTATINPLDLPEIRLVLAKILSLHALSVCVRVSKDWNRSFMIPLWRHISLRVEANRASPSSTKVTTLEQAIKHRELIRSLTIQDVNEWRVRQRKELWKASSAFPVLRCLILLQTGGQQIIIKPESVKQLEPRFSNLDCLNFHPYIALESESYEEILSGCPQLQTLRGGNVKAKVLTEGRPWVCTLLRHWSLCLDFGAIGDYRGKITDTAAESSDSASPSSMGNEVEQQVEQMRKEVRRQLFQRMSVLVELESVDFRQQNPKGLSQALVIDHNDSGLESLLQCPRLKEVMFDWEDSESETYHWIRTRWQEIDVNSLPASEDDYEDEDEDDEDIDDYGSDVYDSDESDEYGYRQGRGPYCARCDSHGCSHYAEVLKFRHKERRYRDFYRRW